ncbi:hypothetical protein CJD36_015660 [Flavipsychrobacter stenotrophus]|uniref:Sce7726 family protein n=1 Tax=Flavipsychrobacter stenotrophus TaxID=2077091 RepID=A0A2S7ST70_9BACT|nr:sce7726 family protein [Flavipsychrobacter stenotrophus]PQJ10132.1 hypothetical protein CJD36_015660 [Flavipsychrobacter stenotrophus]
MKDPHIRQILQRTELSKYINDPHSKVVHEMKLPVASARIDMAVINGSLHAYEIKSASDSLQRLPNQIAAYSLVFDYLTVVTEEKYIEKIIALVPDWVGVAVCSDTVGEEEFKEIKSPLLNKNKKAFYLAKLLWNDELIKILTEQNIPFGKRDRNWLLCESLASGLDIATLSDVVRKTLKERQHWKN